MELWPRFCMSATDHTLASGCWAMMGFAKKCRKALYPCNHSWDDEGASCFTQGSMKP